MERKAVDFGVLEAAIRASGLIRSNKEERYKACENTIRGEEFVSFLLARGAQDLETAFVLGREMIKQNLIFYVDPATNKKTQQEFGPSGLLRFASDSASTGSKTMFVSGKSSVARLNSVYAQVSLIKEKITSQFAVLSKDEHVLYFYLRNSDAKPISEYYVRRSILFTVENALIPTESDQYQEMKGSFLVIIPSPPQRQLLLRFLNPSDREKFVKELTEKGKCVQITPPLSALVGSSSSSSTKDAIVSYASIEKQEYDESFFPFSSGHQRHASNVQLLTQHSALNLLESKVDVKVSSPRPVLVRTPSSPTFRRSDSKEEAKNQTNPTSPRSSVVSKSTFHRTDSNEQMQHKFLSQKQIQEKQKKISDLRSSLHSLSPFLGFSFDGEKENGNPFEGLWVDMIEAKSPAAQGGLRSYDVIITFDRIRTRILQDLLGVLKNKKVGDLIWLEVDRPKQAIPLGEEARSKVTSDIPMERIRLSLVIGSRETSYEKVIDARKQIESLEDEIENNHLSLEELVTIPQYRYAFSLFLRKQHCLENLSFLLEEQAYCQMFAVFEKNIDRENNEKRATKAQEIFRQFISQTGDKVINIDFDTRKVIEDKIQENNITATLFEDAARIVFSLLESDVYRRFQQSSDYQVLLNEINGEIASSCASSLYQSEALKQRRRRTNSFALCCSEEGCQELENILALCVNAKLFQDHKAFLMKIKSAATGSDLVDFMMKSSLARTRGVACSLLQRLCDAGFLRLVQANKDGEEEAPHDRDPHDLDGMCFFEDSEALYSNLPPEAYLEKGPSILTLFSKAGKEASKLLFASSLLLKGVHFTRYIVINVREKKKLYFFRSVTSPWPCFKVHLKNADLIVYVNIQSFPFTVQEIFANNPSSPSRSRSRTSSASNENKSEEKATPLASSSLSSALHPASYIAYFHLRDEYKRLFVFRCEGKKEIETWLHELARCDVKLKHVQCPANEQENLSGNKSSV